MIAPPHHVVALPGGKDSTVVHSAELIRKCVNAHAPLA